MYALTRGIALAFYAAAAYYGGVWLGGLTSQGHIDWGWLILLVAACLWLFVAFFNLPRATVQQAETLPWHKKVPWPIIERVTAATVLALFGDVAGVFVPVRPHRFMAFGIAVPFCLLFALRMHRVFLEHDVGVAKTILNDFMVEPQAKI